MTNTGTLESFVLDALAIALCVAITFGVRGQPGGLYIIVGVGLVLFRELLSVFVPVFDVALIFSVPTSRASVVFLFGSMVLAFGFIGIGIMRSQQVGNSTRQRIHRWMNVALFSTITIELCLMADQLFLQQGEQIFSSVQNVAHVLSLSLLALLVVLRHVHQGHLTRMQSASMRQTEALVSLLMTVKHELNNDMQVVVGNAELAEILVSTGGDVKKPVSNIVKAASAAIVHIDQLSVFNATNQAVRTAVDLNAILRQSAARLTEQLPQNANVRLELDRLPERILVDGHLFTLCLTNLICRAAQYMENGYEIVMRTSYKMEVQVGHGSVSADIIFIPQDVQSDQLGISTTTSHTNFQITTLLSDSAALIDLSGAVSVLHECSSSGAKISMKFTSKIQSAKSHAHSNEVRSSVS